MAHPERTTTPQKGLGFFAPKEPKTSVVKQGQFKPQWVHIGEGLSTCFIAVAASLLDKLAIGHALNEPALKTLIKKHKSLFPEQMSAKGAAFSSQDRMELLLNQVKTGILTQSLAQTLLELTNDAINHEPARHALYLISEQEFKDAIQFRLAVLANTLNIQIDLIERTQDNNIAQKSIFGANGQMTLTLLLHYNAVLPQIKQPKLVGRLQKMGTPDQTQLQIKVDENGLFVMQNALDHILEASDKEKHALQLMVEAGELPDKKLIALYSQMLTLALEKNTPSYVGPEIDAREMLQVIRLQKSGFVMHEENVSDTKDLVIDSIASMVGLKKADIELAFEQIETHSDTAAKPRV